MERFKNPPGGLTQSRGWRDWWDFLSKLRVLPKKNKIPDSHIADKSETSEFINQKQKDYILWLGHACFLCCLDQKLILIDPFLSEYASPFFGLGPKRFIPSPIPVDQLPEIDIILISHNHYDHLDVRTLRKIKNKEKIDVVVPLGLEPIMQSCGFDKITELNWDESTIIPVMDSEIKITAMPCYHFSNRWLWDRNKTLWCGFAIKSKNHNLYFSGDTGYGEGFKDWGKHYGPFDYAMIGIGAYQPQKLMRPVHLNPEEALQVAEQLSVRNFIPMHWGTIRLTLEPIFEPIERLEKAMAEQSKISLERLSIGGGVYLL